MCGAFTTYTQHNLSQIVAGVQKLMRENRACASMMVLLEIEQLYRDERYSVGAQLQILGAMYIYTATRVRDNLQHNVINNLSVETNNAPVVKPLPYTAHHQSSFQHKRE